MLGVIATEPAGTAVRALLSVTPATRVTGPAGVAVVGLFSVSVLVVASMAVMTEFAAIPVPVTTCPTTRPDTSSKDRKLSKPPVAVRAKELTTPVIVVPAGSPVPARPSPTRRPVWFAVARKDCPAAPPAEATVAGVSPLKST